MAKVTGENLSSIFNSDSGNGNGSTVTFAITGKFSDSGAIWVFVDGIKRIDYTVSMVNNTITFTTAPANGQSIEIKYIKKSI